MGATTPTTRFRVRPLTAADRAWVHAFVADRWAAPLIAVHGTAYAPEDLPGFVAEQAGERIGLVTYVRQGEACEIVTLDSLDPGRGVGTALVAAVRQEARAAGCRRLWLIVTNDNLQALRFYQKRGFVLVALHRGAVEAARGLKPQIPRVGAEGIPIRDELALELRLT